MATTVPNNPYDTQQPKAANTGIVGSTMTAPKTSGYFSRNADVAAEFAKNNLGLTEQQFADVHYSKFGAGEGRSASSPAMTSSGNTTTNTSTAQSPTLPPPPAATPATYTPAQRAVDRPTETAQGQMESILSKDSPLMERARTLARQGMAQRGLVNSSMAQGAGVAAMVDRATPIAQQDAQTFSQASSENMGAKNTAGQFNAGETNRFGLQRNDQTFTASENATQRNFAAAQSQLDRDQQIAITKLNDSLNNANVSRTFAANLALSSSNQVATIAADPNLTPDAKRVAIQNAVDNANSTMQWGSTFYNTTLPTIAGPGGAASTVTSGGTYKPAAVSKPAWQQYLDANPDVARRYGYSQEGAAEHFREYGNRENRPGVTPEFKATL
jgi:hypothetical protein